VGASAHAQPARPGRGSASRVFSANGLCGLASPSPPPVIARRGARGVAAEVRAGAARGGAERARVGGGGGPQRDGRPDGPSGGRKDGRGLEPGSRGTGQRRGGARVGAGGRAGPAWAGSGSPRLAALRTKRLCSARAAGSGRLAPPRPARRRRTGRSGAPPPRGKQTRVAARPGVRGRPGSPRSGRSLRGAAGDRRGSPTPCAGFRRPTNRSMAAIPSSGSLVATHDYYRRLPKADPGHWWTSFFFGKSTLPFMATVLESPEHSESPQASSSTITCDLAPEASRKQPGGQPAKANAGPRS
uniref:Pancreatic progenitor cell differentiation and proliferation factor n=1 Tax=Equus caballus TaxID=9796 RepID=A0A5F5PLA2_HORSE